MEKKPRPQTSSDTEKEIDKLDRQFQAFDSQVKEMTMDRMNMAPKEETDPQTKMSNSDIDKSKEIYLKPDRHISSKEKFNENYRKDYEFSMEYVKFIAENKEIIGETIEVWTKPFAGMPAEFWKVPVNKPIWGPRHLAEQLTKCKYHRLTMQDTVRGSDGYGQYYGNIVVDKTVQRLDAMPVSSRRSIFMGANA